MNEEELTNEELLGIDYDNLPTDLPDVNTSEPSVESNQKKVTDKGYSIEEMKAARKAEDAGQPSTTEKPSEETTQQEPEQSENSFAPVDEESQAKLDAIDKMNDALDGKPNPDKGFKPFWEYEQGNMYAVNDDGNFMDSIDDIREKLMAPGMGLIDFGMDMVGNIPGLSHLDDEWDKRTKFSSESAQAAREVLSPIVASIAIPGGRVLQAGARGLGLGAKSQAAARITGDIGGDVLVAKFSDYSERDEGVMNSLDGLLDSMGNPLGMNIADWAKVNDSDSVELRRLKLQWEAGGFGAIGQAAGYLIGKGLKRFGWYKPENQAAREFLEEAKELNPDFDSVEAISQYRKIASETKDSKVRKKYTDFADAIERQMKEVGYSAATKDPMASAVSKGQESVDLQNYQVGRAWLSKTRELWSEGVGAAADAIANTKVGKAVLTDRGYSWEKLPFQPEVHDKMVDASDSFQQVKSPMDVPRNAVDLTIMERNPDKKAVPATLLSNAQIKEGLMLDKSATEMAQPAIDATYRAGKFSAWVDRFRKESINFRDMDDTTLRISAEILRVDDPESIRKMWGKSIYTLADNTPFEYASNASQRMMTQAAAELYKYYLSPEANKFNARLVQTLSKEIPAYVEAMNTFSGAVSPNRIMEVIENKLIVIQEEIGMAKFIAGYQLEKQKHINKGGIGRWFQKNPPNPETMKAFQDPAAELQLFKDQEKLQRDMAVDTLKKFRALRKRDPEMAEILAEALLVSNGNINTVDSLMKWFAANVSPTGMFIDPSGNRGNMFGQSMWGTWFNSTISIASAGKSIGGNILLQGLNPFTTLMGSVMTDVFTKNQFQMTKQGIYAYKAMVETSANALSDAHTTFLRINRDPKSLMDLARKDYQIMEDDYGNLLENVAKIAERDGDTGKAAWARWTLLNRDLMWNPFMRFGNNAMVAGDQAARTMEATAQARYKAQWDVDSGRVDLRSETLEGRLREAEAKVMAQMFEPNGLLKNSWTKKTIGELTLSEDDAITNAFGSLLNYLPGLTPFLAFGRARSGWMQRALEFTPVSLIGPKVRKTIAASTPEQRIDAMALHGIPADDPHLDNIFRVQRARYMGQLGFGAGLTYVLLAHGLVGSIRGNYPLDPAEKRSWIDNNIKPRSWTVNGKTLTFEGQLPLDPILTLIGDMSYHKNAISNLEFQNLTAKIIGVIASTFIEGAPGTGLEPILAWMKGDPTVKNQVASGYLSGFLPSSGELGILSTATREAQNDIYNDFWATLGNRLPIINNTLVKQRSFYTGEVITDGLTPMERVFNMVSPVKIYNGPEKWQEQLIRIGFPGHKLLTRSSDDTIEYSKELRNAIYKESGRLGTLEKIKTELNKPEHQDNYEAIENIIAGGYVDQELELKLEKIPLYRKIKEITRKQQQEAEWVVLARDEYAHLRLQQDGQRLMDSALENNNLPEALRIQFEYREKIDREKAKQRNR